VKRVAKVLGMVNAADGFGETLQVINGFSDLMVDASGESIGKHAHSAVGIAALPGNSPMWGSGPGVRGGLAARPQWRGQAARSVRWKPKGRWPNVAQNLSIRGASEAKVVTCVR
jgi:hypothetical protein